MTGQLRTRGGLGTPAGARRDGRRAAIPFGKPGQQTGLATLGVVVTLLMALGVTMTWAARSALQSQLFASNHYQLVQARQAARAGMEETIAWVAMMASTQSYPATQPATCSAPNPFIAPCWTSELTLTAPFANTDLSKAPFNVTANGFERLSDRVTTLSYSDGNGNAMVSFQVTTRIRHSPDLAAINYLEITSSATSTSDSTVSASAHQIVYFPFLPASHQWRPAAPLLLGGGLDDSTLNTEIVCPALNDGFYPCVSTPGGSNVAVLLPASTSTFVIGTLNNTNFHGGTQVTDNLGGVWNAMFPGMSQAALINAQNMQIAEHYNETDLPPKPHRTLWYFSQSPFGSDQISHGSAASPAIVVEICPAFLGLIATCYSIGSNINIYGAYYMGTQAALISLDLSWLSSVTVHGVLGLDSGGSISSLTTDTAIYQPAFDNAMGVMGLNPSGSNVTARVPSSWRDF